MRWKIQRVFLTDALDWPVHFVITGDEANQSPRVAARCGVANVLRARRVVAGFDQNTSSFAGGVSSAAASRWLM